MTRGALALVLVAAVCVPAAAGADPVHLQTSVGTDAPVAVVFRSDAELPGRLRVTGSVGYMPEPYVDAFNGLLSAAGRSSQSGPGLLGIRLDRATAWRVHGGWRPFRRAGLVLMAGYGRVDLHGTADARELITSVTGVAPPPRLPEANGVYDVASTLHMFDAELGWEFLGFGDRLVVQTSVGLAATVDSRTAVQPRFASTTPGAAEARRFAQDYVDQVLQSYAFLPTLSLSVGYRFF